MGMQRTLKLSLDLDLLARRAGILQVALHVLRAALVQGREHEGNAEAGRARVAAHEIAEAVLVLVPVGVREVVHDDDLAP